MSHSTLQDNDLRRYLLGLSDASEEDHVGAALLEETTEAVEEIISSAEKKLILDYLHGRLSREELEKFQVLFLASPVRQDLFEEMWLHEALQFAVQSQPQTISEKLRGLIRNAGSILALPPSVPAMSALEATIPVQARAVEVGTPDPNSVTIGCGHDAGVAIGQVFDVFRAAEDDSPSQRFEIPSIGFITITSVSEFQANGRYEGDQPARVGDYVKSRLRP